MRPKCDFCSTPDVRWTYPTRDFRSTPKLGDEALPLTLNSSGGWAACTNCYLLIERGDRRGLANRSADSHPDRGKVPRGVLRDVVRQIHDDFWAQREGPPVPCDPDDEQDPTRPATE